MVVISKWILPKIPEIHRKQETYNKVSDFFYGTKCWVDGRVLLRFVATTNLLMVGTTSSQRIMSRYPIYIHPWKLTNVPLTGTILIGNTSSNRGFSRDICSFSKAFHPGSHYQHLKQKCWGEPFGLCFKPLLIKKRVKLVTTNPKNLGGSSVDFYRNPGDHWI